ncbi:hypothetical protein [Thiocystis violascens]|nr:hypothetical protein [Thiocystis violascens]
MAQSYLAPILPGFLARHPKVDLILDSTDREVNVIEEPGRARLNILFFG